VKRRLDQRLFNLGGVSGDPAASRPRFPIHRVPGRPRYRPIIRLVIGTLALIGLIWALAQVTAAINDESALRAAPACAAATAGPDCLGEIPQTVAAVDTSNGGRALYLRGSTPEIGWEDLSINAGEAADFVQGANVSDEVTAKVWHDKAVAITANGKTEPTYDDPNLVRGGWVFLLTVFEGLAFFILRSASRSRLWRMIGWLPGKQPARTVMRVFGLSVAVVAVIGTMLAEHGSIGGVVTIGLAFAALLYGLFVPHLGRGLLLRLSSPYGRPSMGGLPDMTSDD
jgi:hypothetical protein